MGKQLSLFNKQSKVNNILISKTREKYLITTFDNGTSKGSWVPFLCGESI